MYIYTYTYAYVYICIYVYILIFLNLYIDKCIYIYDPCVTSAWCRVGHSLRYALGHGLSLLVYRFGRVYYYLYFIDPDRYILCHFAHP